MAATAAGQEAGSPDASQCRAIVAEWYADHSMFAATLEELAGQLAVLEPQDSSKLASKDRSSNTVIGDAGRRPPELLQRVMARAPSERLQAYMRGTQTGARLQRQLPEQLDQNLRLLTILAAEMCGFLQQLEQVADAAATALLQPDLSSSSGSGFDSDEALLLGAVVDGITKETSLIERAAGAITLTTPAEEVAAAATIVQLEPFLSSSLLAALRQSPE